MSDQESYSSQHLITWRSGGWALLAGFALALIFLAAFMYTALTRPSNFIGDRKNPATYGFDLSTAIIPAGEIVAAGFAKDELPALNRPGTITPEENERMRTEEKYKYMVSTDRIIGVTVGSEARAYPLRVLNWHEVANDTLGGEPIAVTYNPLCDSAVVFSRRVGDAIYEFGVSGLLYNSNLLMFDRQPQGPGESLWSQLLGKAVAGPSAGQALDKIPFTLTTWRDWLERHPHTEVIAPAAEYKSRYKRDPYISYFSSERVRFPVTPEPDSTFLPNKTPMVILGGSGRYKAFTYSAIEKNTSSETWETEIDGVRYRLRYLPDPPTVDVQVSEGVDRAEITYAFWFAVNAFFPGVEVEN